MVVLCYHWSCDCGGSAEGMGPLHGRVDSRARMRKSSPGFEPWSGSRAGQSVVRREASFTLKVEVDRNEATVHVEAYMLHVIYSWKREGPI